METLLVCFKESNQATVKPVKQSATRTELPNREGEDDDDEPPEGKQAKVKRRLVCIVFIASNFAPQLLFEA